MNEKYEFPCGGDMCENQPCCEAGLGMRVKLPIPQGELLPAEERLANVLKAIEDRMRKERAELDNMFEKGWYESVKEQRSFIQGLDIAWSLVKTEILRRGACDSKFTRGGLFPGLNLCEKGIGHDDLHSSGSGGFYWSDTDAD